MSLSTKDRLAILKGLRATFVQTLKSRKEHKDDALGDIYDLARRVGEFRTGRPEKTWGYYWEGKEKKTRQLEEFDKWISELTREISSQLERSTEQAS